jgi:hypothetical protein
MKNKGLVFGLVAVLVVLHQDFWWWHRVEPMVFGFIPIGLAHHVGISLAASLLGWVVVRYCWPDDVDAPDDAPPAESRSPASPESGGPR